MATELKSFPTCSICDTSVRLEVATVDERGGVVHGDCYFLKIVAAKPLPANPEERGQVKGEV